MKTSIRNTLFPAAAALAVAIPAALSGQAMAMGNAADARYEAYVAQETKANAGSHAKGRASKQVTRLGGADSSGAYTTNGAKHFHLDIAQAQEQHYRGM